MTTFTKNGYFGYAGGGKNGATVDAWLASRFISPPAEDTSQPSGNPDAGPVTTSATFGGPGAYSLSLPTVNDYYVRVQYGGHSYWSLCAAQDIAGQSPGLGILSSLSYSAGTIYTLGGTLTVVDGINLLFPTFTVPPSGNVRVQWSALLNNGVAVAATFAIFESGVQIGNSQTVSATNWVGRAQYDDILSGLTPGATVILAIAAGGLNATVAKVTGFVTAL